MQCIYINIIESSGICASFDVHNIYTHINTDITRKEGKENFFPLNISQDLLLFNL